MPGTDGGRERRTDARRFALACAAGGTAAVFVCSWMLTNARWDFIAREPFGEIQDAQARSLFHGRWNVPLPVVGIEGFRVNGKYYTYFGPFLAVLRMPVLLVTDRLDGRLVIVSMLLALVVLLVATAHLLWNVRLAVRGAAAVTVAEAVVAGVFTFAVGAGSIVAFLVSRGIVYHEVELWGIAWAVATTDALIAFARRPTRASAIAAAVFAVLTLLTRVSVGVGAIVAVTLVAGAQLWRRARPDDVRGLRRLGPGPDERGRYHAVALIVGVLVAVALYAGVNVARFGSPYQLPLDKQVFTQVDAQRRAALAANGNSLFGAKFAPTDVLQYLRPDAIRPSSRFPWVDFPAHRATVVGDVVYDTIDRSSSVPASMPGFTVLAVIGLVAFIRPRRSDGDTDLARLWPPVIGGALGTAFVATIAFVAHRYLADFFPPLLLLAIVGLHRAGAWFARAPVRGTRLVAAIALGVVFVAGAWTSFGLGRVYQRPSTANAGRGVASAPPARP